MTQPETAALLAAWVLSAVVLALVLMFVFVRVNGG